MGWSLTIGGHFLTQSLKFNWINIEYKENRALNMFLKDYGGGESGASLAALDQSPIPHFVLVDYHHISYKPSYSSSLVFQTLLCQFLISLLTPSSICEKLTV